MQNGLSQNRLVDWVDQAWSLSPLSIFGMLQQGARWRMTWCKLLPLQCSPMSKIGRSRHKATRLPAYLLAKWSGKCSKYPSKRRRRWIQLMTTMIWRIITKTLTHCSTITAWLILSTHLLRPSLIPQRLHHPHPQEEALTTQVPLLSPHTLIRIYWRATNTGLLCLQSWPMVDTGCYIDCMRVSYMRERVECIAKECQLTRRGGYILDFYDFQINFLQEFPAEAGKQDQARILPYMPGPLDAVNDDITGNKSCGWIG